MQRYPGYTLASLLDEDAHDLRMIHGLLDPDCGKAGPDADG